MVEEKSTFGLTQREMKLLSKSKRNAQEYITKRLEPSKGEFANAFYNAGGSVEFSEVEKTLEDIYLSGKKTDQIKNNLIKKLYENNYVHTHEKCIDNRNRIDLTYKLPIIDGDTMYGVSPPKLYADFEICKRDLVGTGFSLIPNWTYSGSVDTWSNLRRWQGLDPEPPYKHKWLKSDVSAYSSTNLRFSNELEALRYVYDHMPYIIRFGKERWLQMLLNLNQEGGTVCGWRDELRPMKLRGSEHINLSSSQIPFEIEGILVIVSVERLLQLTAMFRSGPSEWYNYGDCDKPQNVLLALILDKAGMSDDRIKSTITENKTQEIIEILRSVKSDNESFTETYQKKEDPDEDIAFYYASTDEREELIKRGFIKKNRAQIIELSSQMGMRSIFYRNLIDLIEREKASEALLEFEKDEDIILERFNKNYGFNIKRVGKDDFFAESNDLLDDNEEDDMFGMFNEQNEYDLPENDDFGGDDIFKEEQSQWIERSGDPLGAGRRVWDPGQSSELIGEENPRSSSILTLL